MTVAENDQIEIEKSGPRESDPRYASFGRSYYAAIGSGREDLSRPLVDDGRTIGYLAADRIDNAIGWSGSPAKFFGTAESNELAPKHADKALEQLVEQAQRDACKLRVGFAHEHGACDAVGSAALRLGASIRGAPAVVADLTLEEGVLRRQLRKSHAQFVTWGEKEIVTQLVSGPHSDPGDFDRYRKLHVQAAGRETRSAGSWAAQFDALKRGEALLVLGQLRDRGDVAATFVGIGHKTAVYWSGAYDRSNFDKPLAHAPVFAAMVHVKRLGIKEFDLGDLPNPGDDPKLQAIGLFKRGFTPRRVVRLVAEWDFTAGEAQAEERGKR